MTTLTFQNTTLSVIDQNNQKWMPALEVGRALGYKNPSSDISKLYERNKDEFTSSMTAVIDMDTASGMQKVRIFSLRGCWLLGMRSHTKVAKDFRKWVLDILDKEVLQNNQQIAPLAPPPKKYTFDFTEDELQSLVWAWFAFVRGIHTFRYIYPMFQKLGSNMAGEIYGQGFEYSHTAQSAHKILERITKEFDYDPMTNWRVLKHVRGFDPAFKKPTF
ncbi:P22AR C-terminal domain-containing protein [Mannheimia haemolytica]|nr:P22AR C-terminal domain-containing protein [Mannheimia haemolytica]